MDVHKNIELLAAAQEAVLVARSKADGDSFAVRSLRMDRDKYLDLHKVNPSDISKTIDALVDALEAARTGMNDWTVSHASDFCDEEAVGKTHGRISTSGGTLAYICSVNVQIDAALALARKGG